MEEKERKKQTPKYTLIYQNVKQTEEKKSSQHDFTSG